MMLTDVVIEAVEELLTDHDRGLRVIWHVNIELAALPGDPVGGQRVVAAFIFGCPSPILGQVLWQATIVPAEATLNPEQLDRIVRDACEALRARAREAIPVPAPLIGKG